MSIPAIVADALSTQRLTLQHVDSINRLLRHRRYSPPDLADLDRLIDAVAAGVLPATPEVLRSVLSS